MKKKIKAEVEDVEAFVEFVKGKSSISELAIDFGRADLNELAAKLNEVIRKIN